MKGQGKRRFAMALVGCTLALGVGVFLPAAPAMGQGPQMPDPRAMSGISRVDPALPAGQVTVRCLLGSFAEPAVGVTVRLEVQTQDGRKARFEVQAAEAGRASFEGLEDFIGGVAVAEAEIDGQPIRSQPIPLSPQGGSRLLLVKGATAPGGMGATAPGGMGAAAPGGMAGSVPAGPHGAPAAGAHGEGGPGGDLPPFGMAFDLEGRPAGTIVVGVIDMNAEAEAAAEKIKPFPSHPVRLFAENAEGTRRSLGEGLTDAEGRARFEGITHADDERVVAETTLGGEAEPIRSAPFDVREGAKAVVLLPKVLADELNRQQAAARAARSQAPARPGRRPVPPVVRDAGLPTDTVRVLVIDKDDAPVSGARVQVVRIDAARDERRFTLESSGAGVAEIDVTEPKKDALYYVEVIHDGAPYRSQFFDLPISGGASAVLRVFDRTEDASRVRSAVHFELDSLENDKVRILMGYELMVDGDEAYWPRGGMQLWGPDGVSVAKPLPEAERWLEEVEEAPYAKLSGPLLPGEPIKLSMAFIASHDGSLDVDWDAPFPLVGARVAIMEEQRLREGGVPGSEQRIEHGAPEPIDLQDLEVGEAAPSLCAELQTADPELDCPRWLAQSPAHHVHFSMEGFVRSPPYGRWAAMGIAGLVFLAGALAMWLRPRESRADALRRRRAALLARLETAGAEGPERDRLLAALDAIYRQLEALGALEPRS